MCLKKQAFKNTIERTRARRLQFGYKKLQEIFEVSQYLSKCFLCLGARVKTLPLTVHLQEGMRIKADYRCSQSNYGILAVALDEGFVYPYHWGSLKYWYRNRVGFQNIIMHFGDQLPHQGGSETMTVWNICLCVSNTATCDYFTAVFLYLMMFEIRF